MQRAALCPRCRRIIGSNESKCSWCGTSRAAVGWTLLSSARGLLEGDSILKVLITVNIIYYALSLLPIAGHGGSGGGMFGILSPGRTNLLLLGATGTIPIDQFGRFWTLVTANYLHGGILHLVFNMMALRQIMPLTINEYGPARMFSIYTLGGVFGFWISYVAGVPFTIGASAAICSLIGALLYYGKSRGGTYGSAVYREVSGWVISLFIFGLIFPGINNWGHGGGILGGIIFGKLFGYNESRREKSYDRATALICAIITIILLVWALITAITM